MLGTSLKWKLKLLVQKNQQECDEVNAYHNRLGFDVEIKPGHTMHNPGLRQLAKICLNSLG